MHFSLIRRAFAALLVAMLVSACGGGSSAPPPVGGLTVVPGDGQITVSWKTEPGVQYWLFYAPAASISTSTWTTVPGAQALINVTSPYVITGLANTVVYSFVVNARTGDGPGGAATPSLSSSPRAAGEKWNLGSNLGTTLRAITAGTLIDASTVYMAVGDNGKAFKSPTGLSDWVAVTNAATSAQLNAASYFSARMFVAGNGGTLASSNDLITWTALTSTTTQRLNGLAGSANLLVAVGDGGTLLTSADGVTWIKATVPTTQNLNAVAYSVNGFFIAVGDGGTVLTSTDGTTWTKVASTTTANLRAVTVQVALVYTFIAVGDGGTIVSSVDNGTTWATKTSGTTTDLLAVSPASFQFLVTGKNGTVLTSLDGATWTSRTTGTTTNLNAVLGGNSQFVAVGDGGVTINSQ